MSGCGHRGAAPVAVLGDLDPVAAVAVLHLRLWADGPRGVREVTLSLERALGPADAQAAAGMFADLYDVCLCYGRRPLMHHQVTCRCVGADEACFANLIGTAVDSGTEEAMLMATLLVRADAAPMLAALAREVGLTFKRVALRSAAAHPHTAPATLH